MDRICAPRFQAQAFCRTRAILFGALGLSIVCSPTIRAQEPSHDVVYFVSADATRYSEARSDYIDDIEFTPTVDVIYSRASGHFRMFGELLATDEEEELERFQLGWQLSDDTRFWLGRFHHSGTYWNTQHHHGQFLQTSITRPAIDEFEDTGGVLPMNVTGLLRSR
jgi:hypothetical protein